MPNDVQVLLENISIGFRQSLPEAIAATLVFVLFISGLVYYYNRQQREARRTRQSLFEARYDSLFRNRDLPIGSKTLLDRLARHLRDPSMQFLLLENEATFNSCLRKLTSRENVSPALVAALRMKLGYRTLNPERPPLSSGDVAEETVVLLERFSKGGGRERFTARIVTVDPRHLTLEAEGGHDLARGDQLKLFFYNFAGLYMFPTRVLAAEQRLITVAHSNAITAVQRRRYYRRKLSAPAFIRRVDGEDRFIKTLLQDLGGGGARVVNPHDLYDVDDRVELVLDVGLHRWIKVTAEVVRVGKDGTISLLFDGVRETTRDLILRSLFKRYTSQSTSDRGE